MGPTKPVLPEDRDRDRIQSLKDCVLKYKLDCVLDKNRTLDNVHKHNICTIRYSISTPHNYSK
jgi:hypothetical protein